MEQFLIGHQRSPYKPASHSVNLLVLKKVLRVYGPQIYEVRMREGEFRLMDLVKNYLKDGSSEYSPFPKEGEKSLNLEFINGINSTL